MRNGFPDILVDTNVIAYAYDPRDPGKQQRSIDLLERLERRGRGSVSVQVLGELYTTLTRRLVPRLEARDAEERVVAYARSWTVFGLTTGAALDAIRASTRYQLPYWDGLIWATAKLNAISLVLTEDFSDGRLIEGVRFLDPFAPTFDVASLV